MRFWRGGRCGSGLGGSTVVLLTTGSGNPVPSAPVIDAPFPAGPRCAGLVLDEPELLDTGRRDSRDLVVRLGSVKVRVSLPDLSGTADTEALRVEVTCFCSGGSITGVVLLEDVCERMSLYGYV